LIKFEQVEQGIFRQGGSKKSFVVRKVIGESAVSDKLMKRSFPPIITDNCGRPCIILNESISHVNKEGGQGENGVV
jgi:hypothetical protein